MKAILEFDLDNPDEKIQHLRCIKAEDMIYVLFKIQRNLRKQMTTENTPDEYLEGVVDTINHINELLEDEGIYIDDLIN